MMRLHQIATTWVRANCPAQPVHAEILDKLYRALRDDLGYAFIIGERLMKNGEPYLVQAYCGELFVFELTARQMRQFGLKEAMVARSVGRIKQDHQPHREPPVRLVSVALDHPGEVDMSMPLSGKITLESEHAWSVPLAIQLVCEPIGRNSAVHYHHFNALPAGTTTIPFAVPGFSKIRDRSGRPYEGPLPLFVQVCVVGEPELDFLPAGKLSAKGTVPGQPVSATGKEPLRRAKLGTPYPVPPTALAVMAFAATNHPLIASPNEDLIRPSAQSHRFRAVSDIRAILVDVVYRV